MNKKKENVVYARILLNVLNAFISFSRIKSYLQYRKQCRKCPIIDGSLVEENTVNGIL